MDYPERWRDRYGPAFAAYHLGLFMMAVHFGVSMWVGGSPVTPELYGPAVYYIPALCWAGVQMFGALTAALGSIIKSKYGPTLMVLGGSLSFLVYSTFVILAQRAEQGTIVQAAGIWCACTGSVLTILAGLGAIKDGRG